LCLAGIDSCLPLGTTSISIDELRLSLVVPPLGFWWPESLSEPTDGLPDAVISDWTNCAWPQHEVPQRRGSSGKIYRDGQGYFRGGHSNGVGR
jgi:hypothetical protein